jgi:hypothetical protein
MHQSREQGLAELDLLAPLPSMNAQCQNAEVLMTRNGS